MPSDGAQNDHVVEVPDRETQIPIDCPGCGENFSVLLSEKIGGASCTACGDVIGFARPSVSQDQSSDADATEQTTLIPDGGESLGDGVSHCSHTNNVA